MIRNLNKTMKNLITILALAAVVVMLGTSCKSKKKVSELSDQTKTETTSSSETMDDESEEMESDDEMMEEEESVGERDKEEKMTVSSKLSYHFASIANASNLDEANRQINEALKLFESPGSLVLIIINKSGNQKDYDRPTTAKEYLNYLKDQKKNINAIDSFKTNSNGKITELELIKKK